MRKDADPTQETYSSPLDIYVNLGKGLQKSSERREGKRKEKKRKGEEDKKEWNVVGVFAT